MIRELLSILLASIFTLQACSNARALASGAAGPKGPRPPNELAVQQKVLAIAPNVMVRVRMRDKEQLRGRLGKVSDEGFALKIASGDTIQDRQVAFTDVKSIKEEKGSGSRATTWILVGVLAGAAIAVLAIVAVLTSNE